MDRRTRSASFAWNAGGWFGGQVGSTLWLLILGLGVVRRDNLAGLLAIGGFAALNLWGLILWRAREKVSAYTGIQGFLGAATAVVAIVVLVAQTRQIAPPRWPGDLVTHYLPTWVVLVFPGIMVLFWLRDKLARPWVEDDG